MRVSMYGYYCEVTVASSNKFQLECVTGFTLEQFPNEVPMWYKVTTQRGLILFPFDFSNDLYSSVTLKDSEFNPIKFNSFEELKEEYCSKYPGELPEDYIIMIDWVEEEDEYSSDVNIYGRTEEEQQDYMDSLDDYN